MCEYTGRKDDPQRHSRNDLPEDVTEDMTKALLNESLADCGRTGLAPFCKTNPAPASDDKFWRVKYDHEAAKKARKAKKASKEAAPRKKGSRPTTSELMQLSDNSESEDDTGASNPVVEEVHESRRHTRTDKSTDLSSGLPDASRKRRTEVISKFAQAKITKRAKKSKPVDEPDLPEPEAAAQEPPAASAPEAAAPTTKTTTGASVNLEASNSAPPVDDPDVVITGRSSLSRGDLPCWPSAPLKGSC
ncbi:hypothetical protein VPH35_039712 [Triticum aestivum]